MNNLNKEPEPIQQADTDDIGKLEMENETPESKSHTKTIEKITESMTRELGPLNEIEKQIIAKTYHDNMIDVNEKISDMDKTEQLYKLITDTIKNYRFKQAA